MRSASRQSYAQSWDVNLAEAYLTARFLRTPCATEEIIGCLDGLLSAYAQIGSHPLIKSTAQLLEMLSLSLSQKLDESLHLPGSDPGPQ